MKAQFEKGFRLRTADFDCYRRLKPSSVLDLFQDVAGNHAENLGIGYDYMLQNHLFWVLTKVKYRIVREGRLYDKVKVRTWPLPPTKISFQREYVIENEVGEALVCGTSEWVLVHSEKRKLMPVKDLYPFEEKDFCTIYNFVDKLSKVPDFTEEGDCSSVITGFCDLDMNGHVNNTKYADYVMNAMMPQEDEKVQQLQIDYHREVKCHENLSVYTHREGNVMLAKGFNAEGEKMFSCKIIVKKPELQNEGDQVENYSQL